MNSKGLGLPELSTYLILYPLEINDLIKFLKLLFLYLSGCNSNNIEIFFLECRNFFAPVKNCSSPPSISALMKIGVTKLNFLAASSNVIDFFIVLTLFLK